MRNISFKGMLAIGEEDRIKLSTMQGRIGYRIVKFLTIAKTAGAEDSTSVCTIYKTEGLLKNITTIDLTNPNILAIAYKKNGNGGQDTDSDTIISDLEVFNQDIYIVHENFHGDNAAINYYIELEQIKLDLNENTVATLKDIRNLDV